MYVFNKVNQAIQRDFNCKLCSWTRDGVAKQGTWMVCLHYVLYWFSSSDPANLRIKYRISWSCFPFYVQLANDILLIKNIISNTPRHIFRWNTRMDMIEYLSTKYVLCRFDNHSMFIDVLKIWASPGERYSTVAWLDHLLLVRTSVTINEVYSLNCLQEFVSLNFCTIVKNGMKQGERNIVE